MIYRALLYSGIYEMNRKDNLRALKCFNKVLEFYKKSKNLRMLHPIYFYIAKIKLNLQEFRSATYNINQSLYYYKLSNNTFEIPKYTYFQAKIYFEAENYKRSKTLLNEAMIQAETYKNPNVLKLCEELEKELRTINE